MTGHILIIDDDHNSRTMLKTMLEHLGYTTATAGNGIEGLEEIAKQRPDLILLDLMMPRMSGFELMGSLRGQAPQPIPIVIMSSLATASTQMERLPGVIGALRKGSFSIQDVQAIVQKALPPAPDSDSEPSV